MKRALNFTLGSAIVLALLIALGVQFISGAPPDQEQLSALAAPRGLGRTIVVTSPADSGPGTLRQALLDARGDDSITFDPAVFLPSSPVTITLASLLPTITQDNLAIDASNAGVILDGSVVGGEIGGERTAGLGIQADEVTIRGLQIVNFPGCGIELRGQGNTIGGDRETGSGPLGQGNLLGGNGHSGVCLFVGGNYNTITGNYIGTNLNGTAAWGNDGDGVHMNGANHNQVVNNLISGNDGKGVQMCCTSDTSYNVISSNRIGTDVIGQNALGNHVEGIGIADGASSNVIGPGNSIAYNGSSGIRIYGSGSLHNTITQNSIHDNAGMGIDLGDGGNGELAAPVITALASSVVTGTACANCIVEVFSDNQDEGNVYEGRTTANASRAFAFTQSGSLAGPQLTATATDAQGNTSEFSTPRGFPRTFVVTSTADSGPGTLRQALLDAESDATITFDPAVFPPTSPMTITLTSGLPEISQGNLTIDASNAGVILDGSNIGTTPETVLLDDISLTLDGGPNLIGNGDFSAGLGHWRPYDGGPGATRSLDSSDFHSSPSSYAWITVARARDGHTFYDTADTNDPFQLYDLWPASVWLPASAGSTAELRFWYKYGGVSLRLHVLFSDGHREQISDWRFDSVDGWTEAATSQILPTNTVGMAFEFVFEHTDRFTNGFSVFSDSNIIRGLQIVNFPHAGIALDHGAQYNTIGGDRTVGIGPLGQGNLLGGNGHSGVCLFVGGDYNTITGNYIGTNLNGTAAWGNGGDGVHMNGANHNQVVDNLISGNGGKGVQMCCTSDTSYNVISGNRIGTDANGQNALGNHVEGIGIADGASSNVIGPGNSIAYNGSSGIRIYGSGSLHNTITQNSIHDNQDLGIDLGEGGNTELAAPLIFDFDLNAGTVSGNACANCAVEVFSDSSDEGEVYEGGATTNGFGTFTFNKGASFTGTCLTVTTTDADGNTSEFSMPTSGTHRTLILQVENNRPKTPFRSLRSGELADNRIGAAVGWPTNCQEEYLDSELLSLGAKRVKVAISELEPESILGETKVTIDWSRPEFSITPDQDSCITTIVNNGITITYILSFWDKANHPQGWEPNISRFRTQDEIQHYLEYVRFIVNYFKGRVQYYEIWNEPNNKPPLQWIQVNDYINLVKQTVPIIRQEDPDAKIVVGSVVLQQQEDRDYLFSILESDVMPLVDVVSWHAMFGVSPEYNSQYYYGYPSLVQRIKEVAAAHGFNGEYWGEELLWRSPDCPGCYPGDPLYSNTVGAKYLARGIVMHLGMDLATQVTGNSTLRWTSFSTIRNLCTIMAGTRPVSLSVEIQSEATNIRSYSFSLAGGDHLVTLWTDGVAVDDDPGITTTLTLPGSSDQRATGIDVLYSFEQQVITDTEDGNLVIRNLLVKDYPIILRLAPTRYVFLPIVLKGYAR
jgi:hypothetical protein